MWAGYRRYAEIAWRASRPLTAMNAAAVVVTAAAPIGAIAAMGAVVGRADDITSGGLDSPGGRSALWWSLLAGGLLLLQWITGAVRAAGTTALGERIDALMQRDLMAAVARPVGIAHLEAPATLDLLSVGRQTFRSWMRPGQMAMTVSRMVTGRLVLSGAALVMASFHPLAGVTLLVATAWAAHEDKVAARIEAAHHYGDTEIARRVDYFYELAVSAPAAKEVRVFGLGGFLRDRYDELWARSMVPVFAPAGRRPLLAACGLVAVMVSLLAWIAVEAAAGRTGAGPATTYAQTLLVSLGALGDASWAAMQTELTLATLRRYDAAMSAMPTPAQSGAGRPATGLPAREIRFEGVGFAYPGAHRDVLNDLDLVIPAGASVAIVGVNGAGKTTLVKLLCRMYEPSRGRITVDGLDLTELAVDGWRRRVAAVFQDAVQFELSARDNVAFGSVDAFADQAVLDDTARAAGLEVAIAGLSRGWDTPLSTQYAGGADLSGGEWQKVGLARALFKVDQGAGVLVLDEPAAHLDARAEARLYEQFLDLTRGLTTVVISHRFSTVRQADSIVVLREGRVVERGNHDELLAAGGDYAEMFMLQAERFTEPDVRVVER